MSPKIVNKQEKKDQIVQAAMTVFIQKGFAKATINDIAAEAGIGKGTIYEYFKNKDEIINYSFYFYMRQFESDFENLLIAEIPASGKLRGFMDHFATICDAQNQGMIELLFEFWSEGIRSKYAKGILINEMKKFYQSYRSLISDIILEGMGDGSFKKDINPVSVASSIVGALDGLIVQWVLDHNAVNYRECVKALNKMISDGIANG